MIEGLESIELEEPRDCKEFEDDGVDAVLEPSPTAGLPVARLEVEVTPTLETAFIEPVVGCVVVAPEDTVPAEFCIDDAESTVPDAGEPSKDVDTATSELVGMFVDEVKELVT
jgi:hypothetical protein